MKAIVLAAGQGTRLRPLTDHRPKCMVEYRGRPIIDRTLDALGSAGIEDVVVIGGFCFSALRDHLAKRNVRLVENPAYASCNMVKTLFCAERDFDDDLLVSYGDIIYDRRTVQSLADCADDLSIAIDLNWHSLWCQRMENPLEDAETMKLSPDGHVLELGKKPQSLADIQAQYIGLIKFSASFVPKVVDYYRNMDRNRLYDGKDFDNMYMTSFLQNLIDSGIHCKGCPIAGPWLEIDSPSDLEIAIDIE